jgi:hypothetical protein
VNTEQIKEKLLSLEDAPMEFTVVLSGKKSRKVHGLYKAETREIILHNKNFADDEAGRNLLLYTAIHEYAHHLQACAHGGKLSARAHTTEFWAILHSLLEKAQAKKVYRNVFDDSPELEKITVLIREKYLEKNGTLVKEMGKHLLDAYNICVKIGGRFEDYVDRVLRIPRLAAKMAMQMFQYDLNPAVGADNMRYLAGIRSREDRAGAEAALLAGKSPDTVKETLRAGGTSGKKNSDEKESSDDIRIRLEKEKLRLEKTISTLSKRLKEVKAELGEG